MILEFEKWHGCKNDFILVWTTDSQEESLCHALRKAASSLCNRDGSSIGADGILLMVRSSAQDLLAHRLRIINADGSLANHCGNGIRCAIGSSTKREFEIGRGVEPSLQFSLEVGGQEIVAYLAQPWQNRATMVAVGMGIATLGAQNPWYKNISEANAKLAGLCSSIGVLATDLVGLSNNHVVLRVKGPLKAAQCLEIAEAYQKGWGLDGINVHFCWEVLASSDDKKESNLALGRSTSLTLAAISYERGVGFTQACGSGACAIGVLAIAEGFCEDGVTVKMPGGNLFVTADDAKGMVTLHGASEYVFSGRIDL